MTITLTPTLQIHGSSFYEVTARAPVAEDLLMTVGSFILTERTHWIHGIALLVMSDYRGKGVGTLLMREALAFAGNRKPLVIEVGAFEAAKDATGGLSDAQLFEWYMRLGFTRVMDSPNQMVRKPLVDD